ncbi:MAG: GNAT family N-acetyltransferase [Actinomycetota bacterium]|nr:GNAT family N-acetyltransferase [Actinomycetota bacterium]
MPPRDSETPEDLALLRRMLEIDYALERRCAELIVPVESGRVIINPGAPLLWDGSYLAVESAGHTAAELARSAAQVLGDHGFRRPTVAPIDPVEARRLEPEFMALGWDVDRGVYMVLARPPDRPAAHEVEEVTAEQTLELRRSVLKEAFAPDYEGDPDEVADQLLALDVSFAEAAHARWFVARADGEIAACASLLSWGDAGQVETVLTAPGARDRGLARAVVLAVVEESRRGGHELTYIGAEADDWPWKLYQRLGFDPVGIERSFTRR